MSRKKSIYRIVPYELDGNEVWALKDGKSIIKTFFTKQLAEAFKNNLESKLVKEFTK